MSEDFKTELGGGAWIISALFLLVTLLYPNSTGMVGEFVVKRVLLQLFGSVIYVLPLYMGLAGLIVLFKKELKFAELRLFGLNILLLNTTGLVEIFNSGKIDQFFWPPITPQGGYSGFLLSYALQKVGGLMGSYFLLIVGSLLGFLLLFKISPVRVLFSYLFAPEKRVQQPVRPIKVVQQPEPMPVIPARVPADPQPKKAKTNMFQEMFDFSDHDAPAKPSGRQPVQIIKKPGSYKNYLLPPLDLLRVVQKFKDTQKLQRFQLEQEKQLLENTLNNFNVEAQVVNISQGPAVTRYELMPSPGVKVNKITNLTDDISLAMATTVRIEAPVPGKSVIGIEVPRKSVREVTLSELVNAASFAEIPKPLLMALGLDIGGKAIYADLSEMPHLLIAGATGSGKSVCLNSIIMSIILKSTPAEVRFLMIDPKRVELSPYNDIPHLVAPVIHEPNLAQSALRGWAIPEMEKRYEIFSQLQVRNIAGYNRLVSKYRGRTIQLSTLGQDGEPERFLIDELPYIVIIIDELADLMMVASREVEGSICRLAQMARATGIHLIIATQRPSVDVITGLIKANIPSRIAFAVGSQIDSRTIIDGMGAEKLLGRGDMLYSPVGARHLTRAQGVYVSDEEIVRVTNFIKRQARPNYLFDLNQLKQELNDIAELPKGTSKINLNQRDDGRDVLFDEAAKIVAETGRHSASFIQRRLRIGFNRAARIMEELDEAGVVKQI